MITNNTIFNKNLQNKGPVDPAKGSIKKISSELKLIKNSLVKSFNKDDNVSSSLSKNDSVSIGSNTPNYRVGEKSDEGNATKQARQSFNQIIFDHFLEYKKDESYKPTIAKLDSIANSGIGIKSFEKESMNSIKKNNPTVSGLETVKMAYRSAMVSTISNSYSDPNFFNGEKDKSLHYFASASLTTAVYSSIPALPNSIKRTVAGGTVLAIGWLKEVASIPGTGFSKEDMAANKAGINSAKSYLKAYDK